MERARYVLLYYHASHKDSNILPEREIKRLINLTITKIYGIDGSSSMGIYISWVSEAEPMFIARLSHEFVYKFFNCLLFLRELTIIPLKSFGSIKKAKIYLEGKKWNEIFDKLNYDVN